MATNVCIRLPSESVTSTTKSAFQSSVNLRLPESSSRIQLDAEVIPYNTTVSARTGKLPLTAKLFKRSQMDREFHERMEGGRSQLAFEMGEILPDSLAKLRLQKGLSQTSLASVMKTSQSHIAKIEAGLVKLQFSTVVKLADALAVSLDQIRPLIVLEENMKPQIKLVAK